MQDDGPHQAGPAHLLKGKLVYLRPWERADLPLRARWLADAELMGHMDESFAQSTAEIERWFERITGEQGRDNFRFVMCRLADDAPVGSAWLETVDWRHGATELGIYVAERAERSRGFGTDALRLLADLALGQLRLERLWLRVFDWNTRAIRSYEKAGFVREGINRHWTWFKGAWQDVVVMSLLRDEWLGDGRPRTWDGV